MIVRAFDTETRGLDWFDPNQRAFLGTVAERVNGAMHSWAYALDVPAERCAYMDMLAEADVLVAHNLSFDVHHTREATGLDILTTNADLEDTDLMSRILLSEGQRHEGGHGLKHLSKTYLKADADGAEKAIKDAAKELGYRSLKTKPGIYYEVYRAYPDMMIKYAKLDSEYTLMLYEKFQEMFDEDSRRAYELEKRVLPVLIEMEQRGMAIDPEAVRQQGDIYEENAAELYDELVAQLGESAVKGAGSESALLEGLGKLGVPLYRKTKTGQISTDKFALQEFEDGYPIVRKLLDYRTCEKFLATYIEPMRGKPQVNMSFRQIGAWTTRMSCTRPNMQNIPKRAGKEVRSMFVPRTGNLLLVADYDSVEVRILAHYLGKAGQEFRDLIRAGHDPHAWMASHIYGGEPSDYAKGTDGEAQRNTAKNTLFAIIYGAGAGRISDMNQLDPGRPLTSKDYLVEKGYKKAGDPSYEPARKIINTIKSSIPGFKGLQARVKDVVETRGYVVTLGGAHLPVQKRKAYVGLNALIQGSAAAVMKQGLVDAAAEAEFFDGAALLVVHDEFVAEVPDKFAEPALGAIVKAMENAWIIDPPLKATGDIRENYSE